MNMLHTTSSANFQTDLDPQMVKNYLGTSFQPQGYIMGVSNPTTNYPNSHAAYDQAYGPSTTNAYSSGHYTNMNHSNYTSFGYSHMGNHVYLNAYQDEDHEAFYNSWDDVNTTPVESYDSVQSAQFQVPQTNVPRPTPQQQVVSMAHQAQHSSLLARANGNSVLAPQQLVSPTIDQETYAGSQSASASFCYVKVEQEETGYVAFNQYPDITTLVNANSNIMVPMVESQFVDKTICTVCGKKITRDMLRHLRTHRPYSRFICKFPKSLCKHKLGKFNRPYDFKKHLLNRHFRFDNPNVKKYHNLSDKLNHWGTCTCGMRFLSNDWLDDHILTRNVEKKCPLIED